MESLSSSRLSAARIALGYASLAVLWIAFSDLLFTSLRLSPVFLTLKGFAFVGVTAYLLYLTIGRLITAVEQTSRERDETAKLYRTVVEASEEGICLLDDCGRISFANRRLAAMLGTPIEKLRGRYLQDHIQQPAPSVHSFDGTEQPRTYECQLRTNSEASASVLVSGTPLLDGDGRFCGSLAMLLDITESKRLEAQLRQSQKLEALGSFAGGITHDFNNLLSIMTGYSSLLETALAPDSEEQKAAREILSACQRGSLLIRQLLAFSRKQPIVSETVDACELVSRFGEVLPRIVGEHIAVRVERESPAGWIRIGAGQIEQILMNFAANARDAMPDGGSLTVKTSTVVLGASAAQAQAVKPGTYVAIRVTDTGTGISPEIKNRIFEPFFTTKPQGTGTGLGLSTVYGIVAQSGGFVTCDSTVGIGTTFTVHLPMTESTKTVEELRTETPRILSGTETVLLVEDEPALRALTKHILFLHGYNVLDASNGIEAVRIVEENHRKIDVVLTDIIMPGMSGIELANQLCRLLPQAGIVFMSGYSDVPGHFAETAHVIQKPVAPDALLVELRRILGAKVA